MTPHDARKDRVPRGGDTGEEDIAPLSRKLRDYFARNEGKERTTRDTHYLEWFAKASNPSEPRTKALYDSAENEFVEASGAGQTVAERRDALSAKLTQAGWSGTAVARVTKDLGLAEGSLPLEEKDSAERLFVLAKCVSFSRAAGAGVTAALIKVVEEAAVSHADDQLFRAVSPARHIMHDDVLRNSRYAQFLGREGAEAWFRALARSGSRIIAQDYAIGFIGLLGQNDDERRQAAFALNSVIGDHPHVLDVFNPADIYRRPRQFLKAFARANERGDLGAGGFGERMAAFFERIGSRTEDTSWRGERAPDVSLRFLSLGAPLPSKDALSRVMRDPKTIVSERVAAHNPRWWTAADGTDERSQSLVRAADRAIGESGGENPSLADKLFARLDARGWDADTLAALKTELGGATALETDMGAVRIVAKCVAFTESLTGTRALALPIALRTVKIPVRDERGDLRHVAPFNSLLEDAILKNDEFVNSISLPAAVSWLRAAAMTGSPLAKSDEVLSFTRLAENGFSNREEPYSRGLFDAACEDQRAFERLAKKGLFEHPKEAKDGVLGVLEERGRNHRTATGEIGYDAAKSFFRNLLKPETGFLAQKPQKPPKASKPAKTREPRLTAETEGIEEPAAADIVLHLQPIRSPQEHVHSDSWLSSLDTSDGKLGQINSSAANVLQGIAGRTPQEQQQKLVDMLEKQGWEPQLVSALLAELETEGKQHTPEGLAFLAKCAVFSQRIGEDRVNALSAVMDSVTIVIQDERGTRRDAPPFQRVLSDGVFANTAYARSIEPETVMAWLYGFAVTGNQLYVSEKVLSAAQRFDVGYPSRKNPYTRALFAEGMAHPLAFDVLEDKGVFEYPGKVKREIGAILEKQGMSHGSATMEIGFDTASAYIKELVKPETVFVEKMTREEPDELAPRRARGVHSPRVLAKEDEAGEREEAATTPRRMPFEREKREYRKRRTPEEIERKKAASEQAKEAMWRRNRFRGFGSGGGRPEALEEEAPETPLDLESAEPDDLTDYITDKLSLTKQEAYAKKTSADPAFTRFMGDAAVRLCAVKDHYSGARLPEETDVPQSIADARKGELEEKKAIKIHTTVAGIRKKLDRKLAAFRDISTLAEGESYLLAVAEESLKGVRERGRKRKGPLADLEKDADEIRESASDRYDALVGQMRKFAKTLEARDSIPANRGKCVSEYGVLKAELDTAGELLETARGIASSIRTSRITAEECAGKKPGEQLFTLIRSIVLESDKFHPKETEEGIRYYLSEKSGHVSAEEAERRTARVAFVLSWIGPQRAQILIDRLWEFSDTKKIETENDVIHMRVLPCPSLFSDEVLERFHFIGNGNETLVGAWLAAIASSGDTDIAGDRIIAKLARPGPEPKVDASKPATQHSVPEKEDSKTEEEYEFVTAENKPERDESRLEKPISPMNLVIAQRWLQAYGKLPIPSLRQDFSRDCVLGLIGCEEIDPFVVSALFQVVGRTDALIAHGKQRLVNAIFADFLSEEAIGTPKARAGIASKYAKMLKAYCREHGCEPTPKIKGVAAEIMFASPPSLYNPE